MDAIIKKAIAKEVLARSNLMLQELKNATPVDTGNARDSWAISQDQNGIVRIANSTDYIDDLNRGTSKQAPSFFIEKVAIKYGKPVGVIVKEKE